MSRPLARLLLLVSLILVGGSTACRGADVPKSPVPTDALPRESELLAAPIALPSCASMRVVEWRPSSAFPEETRASAQAIAVLDEACRTAIEKYPAFAKARGFTLEATRTRELPEISLLPGNVLLDGKDARTLNDVPGRFSAVASGCCYWGLYVHRLNHLFVRNDPLVREGGRLVKNERFVRTFQHELAHVLNARLGVLNAIAHDRARDEELAEDFVAYLGFDYPTESSSDDLAIRTGAMEPHTPVQTVTNAPRKARALR